MVALSSFVVVVITLDLDFAGYIVVFVFASNFIIVMYVWLVFNVLCAHCQRIVVQVLAS